MPVDQTGENILFVMDGEYVEAHVQIQYEGEAERFAWVVPIQAEPEVTVGSEVLFDNLLNSTVPNYLTTTTFESCTVSTGAGFTGVGGSGSFTTTGTATSTSGTGGPVILFQETVGTFDVTVLQSGDATEVTDWLIENDYELAPEAPAILEDYVNLGHVFAAIKLTAGADVDTIHPLVFRYPGTEPCVPLKLTAVAAKNDMAVRAFFLGDDRVYPSNYRHVEFNPVRLDWVLNGSNYTSVVSRAVDEPVADGQAFITEYAGPSSAVPTSNIYNTSWDADALRGLDATEIFGVLNSQGVLSCNSFQCNFVHPQILPLLRKHLPPPDGWTDVEFYMCVASGGQSVTTTGTADTTCLTEALQLDFDAEGFADDYDGQIVEPGLHAVDLLSEWPYLTRMFTTIDPDEMTVDPIFQASPQLSLGVSQARRATQYVECAGDRTVTLPDQREVSLVGTTWPLFSSAMPYAERIEELNDDGELVVLVDNTDLINDELAQWNALAMGDTAPNDVDGGSNGGSSSSTDGQAGADGTGGNETDGTDPEGRAENGTGGGGCSCQVPGGRPADALLLGSLLALAVAGARRRRYT